jgi:hypothetical protein
MEAGGFVWAVLAKKTDVALQGRVEVSWLKFNRISAEGQRHNTLPFPPSPINPSLLDSNAGRVMI